MTIYEAIRNTFWRNYANFSGRASIKEYWLAVMLQLIVTAISFLLAYYISIPFTGDKNSSFNLGLYTAIGVNIPMFIPIIAVSIRRLHDLDRSAWWYVAVTFASIIPLVGFFISLGLIIYMSQPGKRGKNHYGARTV